MCFACWGLRIATGGVLGNYSNLQIHTYKNGSNVSYLSILGIVRASRETRATIASGSILCERMCTVLCGGGGGLRARAFLNMLYVLQNVCCCGLILDGTNKLRMPVFGIISAASRYVDT
jgi:hypothetical protein